MKFNDTSDRANSIIAMIEKESRLGYGTISDNASPNYYLDYFTGKVNEAGHLIRQWIDEVNDEQTSQDTNDTDDNPEATDFTDDTQALTIKSDVSGIIKVEAHDATKTEPEGWYTLDYYYLKDRIEDLYGQDSGKPSKYFIQDGKLVTDIPVDIAKADKYRLTQLKEAHDFTIADTVAEPGINKRFHWLYVYLPIIDWTKDKDIYNKIYAKVYGGGDGDPKALKTMLQDFIMKQNKDIIQKIGREDINYS